MSDYPGAVAAIKSRLAEQWVDVSGNPKTLIVAVNKLPEPPFPQIDSATGNPAPFLVVEVAGSRSEAHTFGVPGNRFFLYSGLIIIHAMVQINEGVERAQQIATDAAEIFRAATFYQQANGSYIRTVAPNPPDGGASAELEGATAGPFFRVTATIPFDYFHRA